MKLLRSCHCFFFVKIRIWRNLVMVPLFDRLTCETGQSSGGWEMWYPLLMGPREPKSNFPDFPGLRLLRHRKGSLCLLPSSRPGQWAAKSVRFLGLEKESPESATAQHGYWPGTLGLWSLWGWLRPFFGLVIHPNGLEIMTNHNNNSQLNKTSTNRNNNWGWEEKWPLGILFRRGF